MFSPAPRAAPPNSHARSHTRWTAWIFELAGGAIADFEDTCVPKEQREAAWTVAALHQWDMGIDDPRCITTAEDVSSVLGCELPVRV